LRLIFLKYTNTNSERHETCLTVVGEQSIVLRAKFRRRNNCFSLLHISQCVIMVRKHSLCFRMNPTLRLLRYCTNRIGINETIQTIEQGTTNSTIPKHVILTEQVLERTKHFA